MGRTSIPVDTEVRDRLSTDKPEDMSWSEYLSVLHSDQEIVVEGNSTNSSSENVDELADQIERLRYELDEFKHDVPAKVAEELR